MKYNKIIALISMKWFVIYSDCRSQFVRYSFFKYNAITYSGPKTPKCRVPQLSDKWFWKQKYTYLIIFEVFLSTDKCYGNEHNFIYEKPFQWVKSDSQNMLQLSVGALGKSYLWLFFQLFMEIKPEKRVTGVLGTTVFLFN